MNNANPTRQDWLVLLFMMILVPLAGEPKMHPFSGDFASFRVSFGSPVFLLFLIWLSNFPRLFTGAVAGTAVMLFRTGLDVFYGDDILLALASVIPRHRWFCRCLTAIFARYLRLFTSTDYPMSISAGKAATAPALLWQAAATRQATRRATR